MLSLCCLISWVKSTEQIIQCYRVSLDFPQILLTATTFSISFFFFGFFCFSIFFRVSFACCLCVCVFFVWNKKHKLWYTLGYDIGLCRQICDQKSFRRLISGNKTTFFLPKHCKCLGRSVMLGWVSIENKISLTEESQEGEY